MTYGEAFESIHRALCLWVPRRTTWSFVQELVPWMEVGLRNAPLTEVERCRVAEGTFVRGWHHGTQQEVNVAIRRRSCDHKIEVVAVLVDRSARGVLDPHGVERLVTDDALAHSSGLARWRQLCYVQLCTPGPIVAGDRAGSPRPNWRSHRRKDGSLVPQPAVCACRA